MTQAAAALDNSNHAIFLLEDRFCRKQSHDNPEPAEIGVPRALWDRALVAPLCDFLSRPAKGFRARLVRLSWELGGRHSPLPEELPLIVEALHAGSLIVDDIEDDSSSRRGAPSLHRDYGVPIALNAGNWLYFWSADLIARLELPPVTELLLHRSIGRTLLACHEGQALDLATRVGELDAVDVPRVVLATTRLKTGKLFELAAAIGAIAAGAPLSSVRALSEFGSALGTGLQMLDDLSGVVSERRRDKGHEDLLSGRPIWPWAWAADSSDRPTFARLQKLSREVVARQREPEQLAQTLRSELMGRPEREIRSHLSAAFTSLAAKLGPSRTLEDVEQELQILEKSYA